MTGRVLLRSYRDLPLAWKLLVPYVVLVLALGATGGALVLGSLRSRAQASIDEQLSLQLLDVRSTLQERELYLLESVGYAANVSGGAAAVAARDNAAADRLLASVLGLKADLALLVLTDPTGRGVGELTRSAGGDIQQGTGSDWSAYGAVAQAMVLPGGRAVGGTADLGGRSLLLLATPVCRGELGACDAVGVALAGLDVSAVLTAARPAGTDVTVFDSAGGTLAASGAAARYFPLDGDRLLRRSSGSGDARRQTVYGPYDLQGTEVGTVAVSVPSAPAFASVNGTRNRLLLLLGAAMLGVFAIGTLLARSILRRVHELVVANRRLGAGELDARVRVRSDDEMGELAHGLNQMAEQLQAAVTTLSVRADQNAEEVERLLRERTAYFASLSHEFRTPLAIIRAQADLMLGRFTARDAANRVSASIVRDAAAEALDLVNDVLEVSRFDAGVVDVQLAECDVAAVIDDLRPTLIGLAAGADLRATVTVDRVAPVLADPRRLRQVLVNLVDNAVKYTPPGGELELAARAVDGMVEISVRDSGIGLPADAMETLFRPFARVEGATTQGGQGSTGLGLSLCKQLVEAQGGRIWAESDGQGSTFRFTVPLAEVPAASRSSRR